MWKKHVLSSAGCCLMKKNEAATKHMAVRDRSVIDFLLCAVVPSSCIAYQHFKLLKCLPPVSQGQGPLKILPKAGTGNAASSPGTVHYSHTSTESGAFQISGSATEDS